MGNDTHKGEIEFLLNKKMIFPFVVSVLSELDVSNFEKAAFIKALEDEVND